VTPLPFEPAEASGPMRVLLTTVPTARDAARIARGAVERRLAACGQHWPIRSVYRWKGRIDSAEEELLLLKTGPKRAGALFRYLAASHPYEVPEIVELDVPRVAPAYLAWLLGATGPGSPRARAAPRRAGSRARRRRPSRRTGRR
jgi:periplasmic divalent cation tolerance protein